MTADFWAEGDYHAVVGRYLEPIADGVVDAARPERNSRVLDVGCGTGNASLAAGRHGTRVVGLDISRGLIGIARERARDARIPFVPVLGDAQRLPFADDTFDATVSVFAHIFAPDIDRATHELVRVTRPGGRIAFTAWRDEAASGAMMEAAARWIPGADPAKVKAGLRLADPAYVQALVGNDVTDLVATPGSAAFAADSAEHFFEEHQKASPGMIGLLRPFRESPERFAGIRQDIIDALAPYHSAGAIRMDYTRLEMTKSES